jgi:4-hydroxybenzoate polyprenyltransferase
LKAVRKVVDFYLYSSIHIALGAALSVILCYAVFTHIPTSDYPLFVFSATLCLYCGHRILGINKAIQFEKEGRFAIIKKYRIHLILYAILGAIGSIYFYVSLPISQQIWLLAPALISIVYVLPIFSNKRRLRDYNFIKIFLISLVWSFIIGVVPYVEVKGSLDIWGVLFALEKFLFIFAITLPFDVRDLEIDRANNVKTIPSLIGTKKTYKISYLLMALVFGIIIILYSQKVYSTSIALALAIAYQLTGFALQRSKGKKDDYYYSGLLDGTIALVALAGIFASGIIKVMF